MNIKAIIAAGILLLGSTAFAADPPATQPVESKTPDLPEQAELDRKFQEIMTNATLVGHFTSGDNKEPRAERYELGKVSRFIGDRWLITARIKYGDKDVTVPLILPVKWAGDTPVITVTDLAIPGLGTYSARVMIVGDHYAGTWSGAKRGGHLWGRIERPDADGVEPDKATPPAP